MIVAVIDLPNKAVPAGTKFIFLTHYCSMIQTFFCKSMAFLAITCIALGSQAQNAGSSIPAKSTENFARPYRILTSGKQITIKSSKTIESIMVWTSGGNRVHEQKDINAALYSFRITVNEKVFFIRVHLADGNTYSEKIGVQ